MSHRKNRIRIPAGSNWSVRCLYKKMHSSSDTTKIASYLGESNGGERSTAIRIHHQPVMIFAKLQLLRN